MTLKDISTRITNAQKLAETDPAAALDTNRDLFLDIARQNEVFIVPEENVPAEALSSKQFRPYISPAQDNDPRLFLRIFSHEDVAKSFSEKALVNQYTAIDGVELMQLARFYFLRGVYGFLLNDGLAWTVMSFHDFLSGCITEIIGDQTMANPEFIALIQLINMVRQNWYYKIAAGRQTVIDAHKPEVLFLLDPETTKKVGGPDLILEEMTIPKLLQLASMPDDAVVRIRTAKLNAKVSPDMFRAALCAAGVGPNSSDSTDLDFHSDTIALDFCIKDFDGLSDTAARDAQLASLPAPSEDKHSTAGGRRRISSLRGIFSRFFAKFKPKRAAAPEPSPDNQEQQPVDNNKGTELKAQKPLQLPSGGLVAGFFCAVAVLLILVSLMFNALKPTPLENLQKAIELGDYSQLADDYAACVKKDPSAEATLLPLMSADLQMHVDDYAADRCSAEELSLVVRAYQGIPAMKASTDSAYQTAAALELSKRCYKGGLLETSIFARLEAWRSIIDSDIGSLKAMQENLAQNQERYRQTAFVEIMDLPPKTALSNLYLLQSYYPDDKEIASKISDVLADAFSVSGGSNQQGGSSGPSPESAPQYISIQSVRYEMVDYVGTTDLHIAWENTSGHTIDRIVFTVCPVDATGATLNTTVDNGDGLYSKYLAVAEGPFESGTSMPDNLFWPSAWVNPSISGIHIVSIAISITGLEPVTISGSALSELYLERTN